MAGIVHSIVGALLIGALNTFGDFVWARFIPAHRPLFGLLHGTLLCLGIGLYLGALRRLPVRGAVAGALIGLGAAGGYYLLARLVGYGAMFVLWMALWVALGVLNALALGEPRYSVGTALTRGAMAALGSGAAFFAVSGIWTRPPSDGPDYAYHFFCWTIAFLPGFLALLLRRSQPAPPRRRAGTADSPSRAIRSSRARSSRSPSHCGGSTSPSTDASATSSRPLLASPG